MNTARRIALPLSVAGAMLLGAGPRSLSGQTPTPAPTRPPNIVFILADDLGYGELGCQGSTYFSTPNIDRLAAQGLRFTTCYAGSAVCSPARCSLLTGLHTGHSSIRDNIGLAPDRTEMRPSLDRDETTVARLLQSAGYATASIGKWGLGDEETNGLPWKQGFDYFYGYLHNTHGTRYYTEFIYRNAEKVALRGNYGTWRKQYGPELCLQEAMHFIEANRERPFFLYYPPDLVHGSFVHPPDDPDFHLPKLPAGVTLSEPEQAYFAMIRRLDRDVGLIVEKIDALGLRENTLIVFASDNGPTGPTKVHRELLRPTGGLRAGKASLYEGGIRVPLIARWPGIITPGRIDKDPVAFWDFLPTVCDLARLPQPRRTDGLSFYPALVGQPRKTHEFLYWELAKRDEPMVVPQQAVREGPWKLISVAGDSPELYNLDDDVAESTDVAARHPEIVARLQKRIAEQHVDNAFFPLESGPGFP